MPKVNIFKIDEDKKRSFKNNLSSKLDLSKNLVKKLDDVNSRNLDDKHKNKMKFSLYITSERDDKNVNWAWILSLFEDDILQITPQPKAVVVIEYDVQMYALTFGHSYFLVDKYCDQNFAFSFARKMDYKEIRTTALTSPNSQRNKTINTYIDYSNLEFDSGESFTKLKAKVNQEPDFDLYRELIEVGSSIKFTIKEKNINSICKLVLHINDVLEKEDIYKIPLFSKVKNEELLEELDINLQRGVKEETVHINFSEFDIIGATEIFNNNDTTFSLNYNSKSKMVSSLNYEEVKIFCKENGLNMLDILLDIVVVSYYNDNPIRTDKIHNLIDYVDDKRRTILSKGEWYYFNDDYQTYLEDSISELNAIYIPEYDFTTEVYDAYIEYRFTEESSEKKYDGMDEKDIIKKLKQKYYAERVFNTLREENDGFKNHDREETRVGNSKIELMDLYKDETMYAVKIGNSSAKLCYAVDQSMSSLKLYKHKLLDHMPYIKNIAVWLVLERKTKLSMQNRKPNINELDMIMLKNKLDIWKKEVRLLGYTPLIYINYRNK